MLCRLLVLLLWCFSATAVVGIDMVTAGPWVLWEGNGWRVGQRLMPGPVATPGSLMIDGVPVSLPETRRALIQGEVVQELFIPRLAGPGTAAWTTGTGLQTVLLTVPPPASATRAARVVVAGSGNWPDDAAMVRLAAAAGGPIDLVLGLGTGLDRVLGLGGWEHRIPVVLAPSKPGDILPVLVEGHVQAWPLGLTWGHLGLPLISDREQLAIAIPAYAGSWTVVIERQATWDPAATAPAERWSSRALVPVVAIASALHLPLVLGGGSSSGLISEPMHVGALGPSATSGGVRYVLPTPSSGGGAVSWDANAAIHLGDGHLVLVADGAQLDLVRVPAAGPPWRLQWRRAADGTLSGTGAGQGNINELVEAWRLGVGSATAPALAATMAMLAAPVLGVGKVSAVDVARLRTENSPEAQLLLGRFAAIPELLTDDWRVPVQELPDELRRLLVWQRLTTGGRMNDPSWLGLIVTTTDPLVVGAVVRRAEAEPSLDLLTVLARRLDRQAKGTTPIEREELIQHRLCTVVLDSQYLDRALLMPIALDLQKRLTGLPLTAVERFLAR